MKPLQAAVVKPLHRPNCGLLWSLKSPVTSKAIVAIPLRDEAERIGACLRAFNDQHCLPSRVVLLLNNCSDGTDIVTRRVQPELRFRLDVIKANLPFGRIGAGYARRLSMEAAAQHADPNDVLLTTDADTIAPPEWVLRNVQVLADGADVVCGRAVIDPVDACAIPQHLHADDALERRLIDLLDELAWQLDPEPYDPRPRHTEASGASIGVTVEAYNRAGGIPDIASGEDRTFVRNLWIMDAAIRHDPEIYVTVSGRIIGRAPNGMAGTIRRRISQQDEFTDERAEPAADAYRRYRLRRLFREIWRGRSASYAAMKLGISACCPKNAVAAPFFGQGWTMLEVESPLLIHNRVRFVDLSKEIVAAELLLAGIHKDAGESPTPYGVNIV